MNYWERYTSQRVTRRRALTGLASASAAGAFIMACGGDDDSSATTGSATGGTSGSTGAASTGAAGGMVTPAVDETDQMQRGGIYKSYTPVELIQFDPHISGSSVTINEQVFSHLLRISDGHLANTDGTIEGDIFDSWELSPDNMTLTAKITKKAHFSNTPPVNGRAVDVEDVMFSWNRFKELGARRSEFVNAVDPSAPIVSMESPDSETIVIQLDKPNSTILSTLSLDSAGTLGIVAKEGADEAAFDMRTQPIGSGPWYLEENVPGTGFYFKRNEGFGQDPRGVPYMDGIDWPNLREYASALAQFKTGSIYHYTVLAEDVMQTKQDAPDLVMRQSLLTSDHMRIFYGRRPDSPFLDERVTRAWSMAMDRDLFLDVIYNKGDFESSGLPIESAWDTALRADTWQGWWLDPQGDDFGENSKYFQFNVEEAKKLLAAAGYEDGLATTLNYAAPGPSAYPPRYFDTLEVVVAMIESSGLFTLERNLVNYSNEWRPQYIDARGDFDGVAMRWDTGGSAPAGFLFGRFNDAGSLYIGSDERLNELTAAAVAEFDDDERRSIVYEIQRYEAGKMLYPGLGGATGLALHWPIVRNREVWRGGSGRGAFTPLFLDPSQPPGV